MLKLGRMRINNFKSFIEPTFFDFTGNDLVLFDGPNGFGKTTIFDAIELCFTGEIYRIKKTDSKAKNDHILKGDNSLPTSIKLEILADREAVLIIEVVIPANITGEAGKVSNYKNTIQRLEYPQWINEETDDSIPKQLDLNKLKSLLGNEKLDSTFTLFNYIQQEETCHFLKLDENKRHQQVSHLFGTTNETDKLTKLDELSKKIKEKIDAYKPTINTEESELALLSNPALEGKDGDEHLGSKKIAKLSDLSSSTAEQIEAYKSNLEGVEWILKNHQEFQDKKFNYQIEAMTTQRINEISNFIKIGSVTSYKEIEKLNKQYLLWKRTCVKATNYTALIETYDLKPNTLTKETLNEYERFFNVQYSKHSLDVDKFDSLIKGSDSCSTILTTIEESRQNLMSHYEGHIGNTDPDSKEKIPCPLCGDQKSSWETLLEEYNNQTKIFEKQLGENERLLVDVTKKLIDELVIPIVVKMRRFTTRYDAYITYNFETLIKIKSVDKEAFKKMLAVKNWLISNIQGCLSYQDRNLRDLNLNYREANELLVSLIDSKNKPIILEEPKEYSSFFQDLKALDLSFDEKGKLVVDSNDISRDILFLSRLIVQKSSSAYKIKEKKVLNLKNKVNKLSTKRDEIADISKVYRKKIKAYEKDVAKHIAIPLFIYSSKILQSRPEGSGIFLITPSNGNAKGFMQFSAAANDSHDAWNTMSSGQLSGVVISFMLAMNKVYPSNLSALMIDDPVQTMDEVNMASFVQMMKYEFPELQVLLSTHESKVANYFNYKYNEAGLRTLPINMKNKRLEISIPPNT